MASQLRVHDEIEFAAQVHPGVELNGLRRNAPQPQFLGDGQQMNLHFHSREVGANTIPGTSAERDRSESMAGLKTLAQKSTRLD